MSTRKRTATSPAAATATATTATAADRAALADHCNRVAHHLRRDLGERDNYPNGGPDRTHAAVAKAVDDVATEYVRTGKPGGDEVIGRIVAQLREIDDDQASELADALESR